MTTVLPVSNPNVTVDRHKYVGGSDLPNILGYNLKYGTTPYLWARQKAGIDPNTFKGNAFTRYGQLMEPMIRDYINEVQGTNFVENTVILEVLKLRGNCDGIDRDYNLLLEIKTHGVEFNREQYYPQVQFYMETFNIDQVWLVGYERPEDFYTGTDISIDYEDTFFDLTFDPERITVEVIDRDRELWGKIQERITAFQKGVTLLRKEPDTSEEAFNRVFYGNDVVVAMNKLAKLETKLESFKTAEKQHKEIKEKLYNMFTELGIDKFSSDTLSITRVAPTSFTKDVVDEAKLKELHPRIYAKVKTSKTTNKKGYVLIKTKKEEDTK